MRRILAALALLALINGCDNRVAQKPTQSTTGPASLDARLLGSLESRRQWPSNAVKVWLKNPTIALDMKAEDGKPVLLHAWGGNESDFNTPMMRVNNGDVLYAVTEAEFEELRARAAATRVP